MNKITILLAALIIAFTSMAGEPKSKDTTKPISLTKATFQERVFDYESNPEELKYLGDKPAILDFHADWCMPCLVTSPILSDLAAEYGDELYIYKIDVDKEPELAYMFGASALPMFLFIPMDGEPQMGVGALPKKSFREVIDTFLLKEK